MLITRLTEQKSPRERERISKKRMRGRINEKGADQNRNSAPAKNHPFVWYFKIPIFASHSTEPSV